MQTNVHKPYVRCILLWILAQVSFDLNGYALSVPAQYPNVFLLPTAALAHTPSYLLSEESPSQVQHISILIANYHSYYQAFKDGTRWIPYWKGEVWIESEVDGSFSLILYRPDRRDILLHYYESLRRSRIYCKLIRYAPRRPNSIAVNSSHRGYQQGGSSVVVK